MNETWIILGATSAMARAFAQAEAEAGSGLILCGRRLDDIEATAADCRARGAEMAEVMPIDMRDPATFGPILERAKGLVGAVNVAVFTGSMPEQSAIDADPSLIEGVIIDSYTGPARFLTEIAPQLEARGCGAVMGITSVAGDRGRIGNYVYGSAKAGFATYLSGYRNRMGRSGVHVLTVKPGPVDTAMTWGGPKLPFMSTPEAVVADMRAALKKRRNILYTAKIWGLIMLVIRMIPEPVFKKMNF